MKEEIRNLLTIGLVTAGIIGGGILVINSSPNNGASVDSNLLIRPDSYQTGAHGPYKKTINVVEFADYQCPACGFESPVLKKIAEDYNGQVNVVFRNFPLPQHDNALLAALAAEAAGEQGKFWEMNHKIYENQKNWITPEGGVSTAKDTSPIANVAPVTGTATAYQLFMGYAQELGLNMDQFKQAVDSQKYLSKIQKDQKDGEAANINSTPTIFINGKKVEGGAPSYPSLKSLIDTEIGAQG